MCKWLNDIDSDNLVKIIPKYVRLSKDILRALSVHRWSYVEVSLKLFQKSAMHSAKPSRKMSLLTNLDIVSDEEVTAILLGVVLHDPMNFDELVRKTARINAPMLWEQVKAIIALPEGLNYILQTLLLVRDN